MADIDVVKKSSNTWIWVLIALVVLAAIMWFVMAGSNTPQTGLLIEDGGRVTSPVAVLLA
jgi:bacteriorhodopsin